MTDLEMVMALGLLILWLLQCSMLFIMTRQGQSLKKVKRVLKECDVWE